jgi:hypothetical protein
MDCLGEEAGNENWHLSSKEKSRNVMWYYCAIKHHGISDYRFNGREGTEREGTRARDFF